MGCRNLSLERYALLWGVETPVSNGWAYLKGSLLDLQRRGACGVCPGSHELKATGLWIHGFELPAAGGQ